MLPPPPFPPPPEPFASPPRRTGLLARSAQVVLAASLLGAALSWAAREEAPVEAAPAPSASPPAKAPPAPPPPGEFAVTIDAKVFQKGNLHTHTKFSDGDSSPEAVYKWYRKHGYAFLAVTDHNYLTPPATYRALQRKGFTLVAGEELTTTAGRGHSPVHVNALCEKQTIGGGHFDDPVAALGWAIGEVHAQGAVALVNHPNFEWALTAKDMLDAPRAELLEIWSGHEGVRPAGDEAHPSEEAIWDAVLSAGRDVAGVAVDDTHHLWTSPTETPIVRPGRAWVQVFAAEPKAAPICAALAQGLLYASNGAELARVAVAGDTYSVWPRASGATVEFIGAGGVVLATVTPDAGAEAAYRLRGGESYVRARVTDAGGKKAWAQAARVKP